MRASIVTISPTERASSSLKLQSRLSIAGTLSADALSFCAHNRTRDRDRIGERLGADQRRPDVEDTSGVLAVDALARAVRFERAFIKQYRAARAVRQDERDRVSGAPSYRLAGQELAVGVEQDARRLLAHRR